MKRLFKSVMLFAAAAMAFTSCDKEQIADDIQTGKQIRLTIVTDRPDAEAEEGTRTELVGTSTYWLPTDQIGVSIDNQKQVAFSNDNKEESTPKTSFSGQVSGTGEVTVYSYYPYSSIDDKIAANGVKVLLPATQHPTATSFDGKADLFVGKQTKINLDETQIIEGLQFKRLTGILKIVLVDKTEGQVLNGQSVSLLTFASSKADLAGRVYINLVDYTLGDLYYDKSNAVTADHSNGKYEIDGKNGTFLCVYPQTLAGGTTLTITAQTESYSINREIVLEKDIVVNAGKIKPLNININDEDVTLEEAGLALPFKDDFSDLTKSDSYTGLTSRVNEEGKPLYSTFATLFQYNQPSGLRFSTQSASGFLVTSDLDLSSDFHVTFTAKSWGTSDNPAIKITAGECEKTTYALTTDFQEYTVNFPAQTSKTKIRVEPSKDRMIISKWEVVEGHVVLPPVLTVDDSSIATVDAEGDIVTVKYTIENPVEGETVKAESSAEWINTFEYDTEGEVSFVVDANTGTTPREGTVTFSYATAEKQQVTVRQYGNTPELNGNYVILAKNGNNYIAAAGVEGTNKYLSSTSFNGYTGTEESVNTSEKDLIWTITKVSGDDYTVKHYNTGKYLYYKGSSNEAYLGDDDSATLTIVQNSDGLTYQIKSGDSRILAYNTGSPRFAFYAGTQTKDLYLVPVTFEITPSIKVEKKVLNIPAEGDVGELSVVVENYTDEVTVEYPDWIDAEWADDVLTYMVDENDTEASRTAEIVIKASYEGGKEVSETITVNQAAKGQDKEDEVVYKKISSNEELTDGTYLIVCEDEKLAFNGSVNNFKSDTNYAEVTISNNTIESNTLTDTYAFTFDSSNGSFMSINGKYIGNSSDTNDIATSNTLMTNTITFDSGDALIKSSGGSYLRYNNSNKMFRYYKSTTYTGQKAVQLYKKVE